MKTFLNEKWWNNLETPSFLREPPFQLTPYLWASYSWPPSLSEFQKQGPPSNLSGEETVNSYLAKHLGMLDSTYKKIAYTIFKDCMIISSYQKNFQLTFTNSKLTEEQERKYVQKTLERHQLTVCSCQLTLLWCFLFLFLFLFFFVFLILNIFPGVF